MPLHIKTLAGEPSVSLIESPSAGIKTNLFGFNKDPFTKSERQFYKESLFKFIGECIDQTNSQSNLMTCDLTGIFRCLDLWKQELPRVTPFYAVKCNTDSQLVKVLTACGVNFDCASKFEIETVLEAGADPSNIIFANACKFTRDIRFAAKSGVQRTTFDNELELTKLAKNWSNAECVLRILPGSFDAQCQLSDKFGASLDIVPSLLAKAQDLRLNVVGISFHVGSGCMESCAWAESVRTAARVAELFPQYGFKMRLLDIGGGFPGTSEDLKPNDTPSFQAICEPLREALEAEFPLESGVEIIAEPGRFFAASLFTAVTEVYGKRVVEEEGVIMDQIYVGDGVYGSFNNIIFDHQRVVLSAIITPDEAWRNTRDSEEDVNIQTGMKAIQEPHAMELSGDYESRKTKIFGPTCDGIDTLYLESVPDINYGDWLVWRDMGAYTISAASTFNGMPRPKLYYFLYRPTYKQIQIVRSALQLDEPKEAIPMSTTIFVD